MLASSATSVLLVKACWRWAPSLQPPPVSARTRSGNPFTPSSTPAVLTLSLKAAATCSMKASEFPPPCQQQSWQPWPRSEEHTSELQSRGHLVCRLLLEKKKTHYKNDT